jgi:DNA-binding CsgD family transcriptional regulator
MDTGTAPSLTAASKIGARPPVDRVSPSFLDMAQRLTRDKEAVAHQVRCAIEDRIPEYRSPDSRETRSRLQAHCLLTTQTWYQALFEGELSPCDLRRMREMGEYKCQIGLPMGSVMQAFRVGSMVYWDQMLEVGQRNRAISDVLMLDVSRFFLKQFDLISYTVGCGYQDEQRRMGLWPWAPEVRSGTPREVIEGLSKREMEVLRLVRWGLSNREIARRIDVSEQTVKFHLKNVFGKLGVCRRTQAIARAISAGLIDANA